MPNLYIENRDRWEQLSAVDFLGAFANAWLAFNAWYRNAYGEHQDRKIINAFKDEPNVVRNRFVPLLTAEGEEAEQLRGAIGLLHHRLENYHLHTGKGTTRERISFSNVYLRDNTTTPTPTPITNSGITYAVTRGGAVFPLNKLLAR